jgi:hypothetical protein
MRTPRKPKATPEPSTAKAKVLPGKATKNMRIRLDAHEILRAQCQAIQEMFAEDLAGRAYYKIATYSDAIVWMEIWLRPGTEDPEETMRNYIRTGKL